MNHEYWKKYTHHTVKGLTPAGRRLLMIFMEHPDQHLSRRDLAHFMGKRYLSRYSRKLLDDLVEKGIVGIRRERLRDLPGFIDESGRMPRNQNIALESRFYVYWLDPTFQRYLSARPPVTKRPPVDKSRGKVYRPSPVEWIREKLGLD